MIKWIPFSKDSMPPDEDVVLVCGVTELSDRQIRWLDFANAIDGKLFKCDDACEETDGVTHWAYPDQINLPDDIPLYKAWARTPSSDGRITAVRFLNSVVDMSHVYGLIDGAEQRLFAYYRDEISFSESELIGLTPAEAIELKRKKDEDYLRS